MRMRKRNSLIGDVGKVWVDSIGQTNYNIPLNQGLMPAHALFCFSTGKIESGEEGAEKKFEARKDDLEGLKKEPILNIQLDIETASADIETAANYPDRDKIIDEGSYSGQQIFSVDKTTLLLYLGRKYHIVPL